MFAYSKDFKQYICDWTPTSVRPHSDLNTIFVGTSYPYSCNW